MLGRSFNNKTLRLRLEEESAIDRACQALNGIERSRLMEQAVLVEAERLGIRLSHQRPPPYEKAWPYRPERGLDGEPTENRITVSLSLIVAEVMSRAAAYVGVTEPEFVIGATLAYIGRVKECFEGIAVGTPEEAQRIRADLRRIRLEPRYQYTQGRKSAK